MNRFQRAMRRMFGVEGLPAKQPQSAAAILPIPTEQTQPAPMEDPALAYGRIPHYHIAVRRTADAVAQLPILVQRKRSDDAVDENGPAQRFVDHPNREESRFVFVRALVSWLELYGEAPLYVDDDTPNEDLSDPPAGRSRPPHSMRILDPRLVEPQFAAGALAFWEYSVNGAVIKIPRRKMVMIREWSDVAYHGVGYGEVLGVVHALDKWADAYNVAGFKYGGSHLRAVMSTDARLTEGQLRRWKTMFTKEFFGFDRNYAKRSEGAKPLIAADGLKITQFGQTMRDLEFNELKKLNAQTITANVGPALTGILEHANYSNMDAQERIFWQNTIKPKLRLISDAFEVFILPRFGDNLVLTFDLSGVSVLQANLSDWVNWVTALKRERIIAPNEARAILFEKGVPFINAPMPGGDQIEQPAAPAPLGIFGRSAPPALTKEVSDWLTCVDDEARLATKQLHEEQQDQIAGDFLPMLRRTLDEWEALVKSRLARGKMASKPYTVADVGEITEHAEARAVVAERAAELHAQAVKSRAETILADLGVDATIDVTSPHVVAYLARKTRILAGSWPDTVFDRIGDALIEGVNGGETINELQARVGEIMDAERDRALMVARTETVSAFNFGSEVGYIESGVVEAKEWLTARDEAVRDEHREADGQQVPVDGFFTVGGYQLSYPGDPGAPPGLIINCRCTTVPILNEEKVATLRAKGNGHAAKEIEEWMTEATRTRSR